MTESALAIMQDAILTVIKVSAPPLVVALIVGFVISMLQATTQIHEQTLAFVPKVVGVFLALLIFGPWMLTQLAEMFQRIYEYSLIICHGVGWA